MKVQVLRLDKNVPLPKYEHTYSAGMDITSSVDDVIQPGERKIIPTGIKIAIPKGYELQLRPRSGLAIKKGITLLNTPGTIDADYRGEVGVILINHSTEPFEVKKGDRIAQMIFNKFEQAEWNEVDELSETTRGEGGFGSTGV